MLSERARGNLHDIVAAIDLIETWISTAGSARAAVESNPLVRSAVERQLLIISEAAIRLHKIEPEALASLQPSVDWAGIRGMGNILRHRYDGLDPDLIIRVLEGRLRELRAAALSGL